MTEPSPEEMTIRAFVQKLRQERAIFLLSHASRRHEFTAELGHFQWLDERFVKQIPSRLAHTSQEIASLLRSKGAGESVWVISEDKTIDGRTLQLEQTLNHIWGREVGTILTCIPGKLGYFEGEDFSCLLEK